MINGAIINKRPLIPVTVAWRLGVQSVLALVDTGFTGELKVSPTEANNLGLQVTHTENVELADNKIVPMSCALAVVNLEGVSNVVSVLIDNGDTIVGVSLLKRFRYIMNANFPLDTLRLRRYL